MDEGGFRILTVCTGNVNRSALAEALLRTWSDWYLPAELAAGVHIGSAGLGAPVGDNMRPRVRVIAQALGVEDTDHSARQITDDDLREADLILTASRKQLEAVIQRDPASLRHTFTIREAGRIAAAMEARDAPNSVRDMIAFVQELAARRGEYAAHDSGADDVHDPEGQQDEAFLRMAREEVPALAFIGSQLFGMPRADREAYLDSAQNGDLLAAGA